MRFVKDLINFVFPNLCHVCRTPLTQEERFVCSHCIANLPRSGFHRRKLNPMEERFAGLFPFEKATGHFLYNRGSDLSTIIQDMKYRHFPSIGNMLGELVASELFSTGFFYGVDIIVPVPMHFWKQMNRGYNQTHHIAEGISSVTDLQVSKSLKAIRSHKTQTSLSKEERLKNTGDIFKVMSPEEIRGRHVLLIDDVCTTGATLISAAETLWQANPSALSILTIAVTF